MSALVVKGKCPGLYCGRMFIEAFNGSMAWSECGACPRGFRVNTDGECVQCESSPSFYDWQYLGFMVILPLILHWFFIDLAAKERKFVQFDFWYNSCTVFIDFHFQFYQGRAHFACERIYWSCDIGRDNAIAVRTVLVVENSFVRSDTIGRLVHTLSQPNAKLWNQIVLHTGGSVSTVSVGDGEIRVERRIQWVCFFHSQSNDGFGILFVVHHSNDAHSSHSECELSEEWQRCCLQCSLFHSDSCTLPHSRRWIDLYVPYIWLLCIICWSLLSCDRFRLCISLFEHHYFNDFECRTLFHEIGSEHEVIVQDIHHWNEKYNNYP